MIDEFGLTVMDATWPISELQRRMREMIKPYLPGACRLHSAVPEAQHSSQRELSVATSEG
jgi:hypothetical protein